MIRKTTNISETSAVEWWVNDCITGLEIDPSGDRELHATFTVEKKLLLTWMREAKKKPNAKLSPKQEITFLRHIRDALHRYLNDEYVRVIGKRGSKHARFIDKVIITLQVDGKPYDEDELDKLVPSKVVSYCKPRQLWAEQLSDYNLGPEVSSSLSAIKTEVGANAVYLFVFDRLSDTIRYLHNESLLIELNGIDDSEILQNQRIPPKCGIIGNVAFYGLVTVVENIENDPRRCNELEDRRLRLHSVMFHPLIRGDYLWAVVMVNRKKENSVANMTFRQEDIETLSKMVLEKQDYIIDALDNFSKPYTD